MKFFQKKGVAIAITVLLVLASSVYGILTAPRRLPEVKFGTWVLDEPDVLAASTVSEVQKTNEALLERYDALLPVAILDNAKHYDLDDLAFDLGNDWGLGSRDMILVIDLETEQSYLAYDGEIAGYFTDDGAAVQAALNTWIDDGFYHNMDENLLGFYEQMQAWYDANVTKQLPNSMAQSAPNPYESHGLPFGGILLLAIFLFLISGLISGARRRRYYGAGPIFIPFWMGRWWRMPPPNYRPPHGGPRNGPGNFGGFGGFSGGSRGGFGGGSRGGFGGGRGGFGGGRR